MPHTASQNPSRRLLPSRADSAELLRLALPVVVVQVGMMLMGVVDSIMVGHVSATALAAVALGNLYFFGLAVFGMGLLMALDPVIAQAFGAEDRIGMARGLQRGLLLSLVVTIPSSALLLTAHPILTLFRQPAEVIPAAASYAHLVIPGVFPFFAYTVLRQWLQAIHRVRPIVWTIVLSNLANVVLNWVLVFGHWGFPAMGSDGSAIGTSISRWLMAVGLLVVAWPLLRPYLRPWHRESLAPGPLARMAWLGVPIGIQFQLEYTAFGVVGLLMGLLGTVQVAGHQVALNLASLTFMVPLGVSMAGAVLAGNAVGRGDLEGARRAARTSLSWGVGFMMITGLLFLTMPSLFARIYTSELSVLAIAVALLPIAGVFQVFDGLQVVTSGLLRGLGDTRAPMVSNLMGFWVIGIPLSILLGFHFEWGARGLWWGLVAGLGSVAVFLLWRLRSRFRRGLTRVMIEQAAASLPDPV